MVYNCGEKPGKGRYKCNSCGEIIVLDDNTDRLPPCPSCEKCNWGKL